METKQGMDLLNHEWTFSLVTGRRVFSRTLPVAPDLTVVMSDPKFLRQVSFALGRASSMQRTRKTTNGTIIPKSSQKSMNFKKAVLGRSSLIFSCRVCMTSMVVRERPTVTSKWAGSMKRVAQAIVSRNAVGTNVKAI